VGSVLAVTVIFARAQQLTAFGLGLSPVLNFQTISMALAVSIFILFIGIAFPAIRINQMSIPNLLGRE
jgi:hypothetical protein